MSEPVGTVTPAPPAPPTRRRVSWGIVASVAALLVMLLVGAAVLFGGEDRDAVTHRFVIPAGTGDRIAAGEKVEIVPRRMEVRVGDKLMLRNKDEIQHHMGPLVVDPNGLLSMTFSDEGKIRGLCTLNEAGEAVILVRS